LVTFFLTTPFLLFETVFEPPPVCRSQQPRFPFPFPLAASCPTGIDRPPPCLRGDDEPLRANTKIPRQPIFSLPFLHIKRLCFTSSLILVFFRFKHDLHLPNSFPPHLPLSGAGLPIQVLLSGTRHLPPNHSLPLGPEEDDSPSLSFPMFPFRHPGRTPLF